VRHGAREENPAKILLPGNWKFASIYRTNRASRYFSGTPFLRVSKVLSRLPRAGGIRSASCLFLPRIISDILIGFSGGM
jgi:hypothetical protein